MASPQSISIHQLSVVLSVGRSLDQLPVQFAHLDLLLGHGQTTLLLQILWEEGSGHAFQSVNGLLARKARDGELIDTTSHAVLAEANIPAHDRVHAHFAIGMTGPGCHPINDKGCPDILNLSVDDLAWLEEQPEPLERGNRRASLMAGLLLSDLVSVGLVQVPKEHVNVSSRGSRKLVIVTGRLCDAIAGQSIAVVDQGLVGSIDGDRVTEKVCIGVRADHGVESVDQVLGVNDHPRLVDRPDGVGSFVPRARMVTRAASIIRVGVN